MFQYKTQTSMTTKMNLLLWSKIIKCDIIAAQEEMSHTVSKVTQ